MIRGWTIPDWLKSVPVGRSTTYELMRRGDIAAVKVGRRTLITTDPAEFLKGRPAYKAKREPAP